MDNNINIYVDGAGRYILGEEIVSAAPDNNSLAIKNPALIVINTGANGQVQIQTIPFFFKELQASESTDTLWYFPKSTCARGANIRLSEQLIKQYHNAINPPRIITNEPNVVKLFDE